MVETNVVMGLGGARGAEQVHHPPEDRENAVKIVPALPGARGAHRDEVVEVPPPAHRPL